MATTDQIKAFILKYQDLASSAAIQLDSGATTADILGQWGNETDYGVQMNGVNNLGGIMPGGKLANYETPADFLKAYIQTMKNDVINRPTVAGQTFYDQLSQGIYEGDKNIEGNKKYAIDVKSFADVIRQYLDPNSELNFAKANPAPAAVTIDPTTWGWGIPNLKTITDTTNRFLMKSLYAIGGIVLVILGFVLLIKSERGNE